MNDDFDFGCNCDCVDFQAFDAGRRHNSKPEARGSGCLTMILGVIGLGSAFSVAILSML